MMTSFTFGLIIFQTLALSQSEKFGIRFMPKVVSYDEISETSESRYQDYSAQSFRNYDRTPRQNFQVPVTFKAPHYEAHDYWQNKRDYDNRRIFFDNFPYSHPRKTTTFPGIYQFMRSFFGGGGGGRDDVTLRSSKPFHNNQNRVTHPYVFDVPFNYRSTEPNYIPPPKPIRASVIKLETITRSPIHASLEYETTTKYYPQSGIILNHVLIENSKSQQNFHPHGGLKFPPFKPLSVLPKPSYIPPTTLTPIHPEFSNYSHYFHHNKTDYKYPESVQDQLPHLTESEIKIPYVSEKPIPQIFNPLPTESLEKQSTYDLYPSTGFRGTTNILGLIEIRSLNPNVERREKPIGDATEGVKSFPGAVEKVNRPTFKKKLTAQLDRSSVERVTNLTIQGFSKPEKESVNVQHIKYLNVRNFINYEMNKLKNTNTVNQTNDSLWRPVNINDELSLDAKILKDTNWDGWSTTEVPKETTTFQMVQPNQRNRTAFWEVVKQQSTTISEPSNQTTITEETRISTTTEFIWTSTPVVEEKATTQETIPKEQEPLKPENPETLDVIIQTTTPRKRYNRRPKITNFTPYPSAEEVQKKLTPRNHFPKRQKPNITLAFGNKNVLKNRQSFETDEVMKFSDEDVRKRKIGKRRPLIKRIKVSPSERPVQND